MGARWLGIAWIALGAVILLLVRGEDAIPGRERLTEVSGPLRSLEKVTGKGGGVSAVRFTLAGDARHFSYPSSAGGAKEVWDALEQAGQAPLSVLIDAGGAAHSPALDERAFHVAFEIRVSGKPVRPYSEVAEALDRNNWLGFALGYLSAGVGVALIAMSLLKRKHS